MDRCLHIHAYLQALLTDWMLTKSDCTQMPLITWMQVIFWVLPASIPIRLI